MRRQTIRTRSRLQEDFDPSRQRSGAEVSGREEDQVWIFGEGAFQLCPEHLRARVFISCGQQRGTDEVQVARRIANKLTSMGFDPYIAVEEQTLRGVKENIFRRLSESEYLVFVDFKRDIPPHGFMRLDAFSVAHNIPNIVQLGINVFNVDFTGYVEPYTLRGSGAYELTYVVFSQNFSPARSRFMLRIGNRLEDIEFSLMN